MPFKTPEFWYQPAGLRAYALLPFAWLYQIGHVINQGLKSSPYKSSIPVICIGNAVAGGSGKTPAALSFMKTIQESGLYKNPYFLTRGYGGESNSTSLVDAQKHNAAQVGDEALLLAKHAPTIVATNRADGAKLAERADADLIIMDDGLQNNSLVKDITFLVIDRAVDFGNGKTIPAGPLREPLSRVLPKIGAVICIGRPLQSDKTVFEADITPIENNLTGKYIAFAGLGRPKKLLKTLQDMKANIVGWHEFADHHLYTQFEIDALLKEANAQDAQLITTEKDHVRLPKAVKDKIKTLPIALNFKDENSLVTFLKNKLN